MSQLPGNTTHPDDGGAWPTLLKDNLRTGGQNSLTPRAPKRVRWQARLGSSIRSAPVLRNELLYVTVTGGTLYAIDVSSGRPKWRFRTADQIHSTPSVSNNKVFFGCDSGTVYAVNGDHWQDGLGCCCVGRSVDISCRERWSRLLRQCRGKAVCGGC